MDSDAAWLVLAVVASACAAFALVTAWPPRRSQDETWLGLCVRVFYCPGTAIVIAIAAWSVVFDVEVFAEEPSVGTFIGALAMLSFVTVIALRDRRSGFGGPR